VVLSDIEMPRMDGFDLVRNMRTDARAGGTAGGHDHLAHRPEAPRLRAELGVDHYLGKPYAECFDPKKLTRIGLRRRPAHAQLRAAAGKLDVDVRGCGHRGIVGGRTREFDRHELQRRRCRRATVLGAASPVRLMPRPTSHLRTRLTFRPWASATAATDTSGCWHSARTCALISAPCMRRWDSGWACIGAHLFEWVGAIVPRPSAPFKVERLDAYGHGAPDALALTQDRLSVLRSLALERLDVGLVVANVMEQLVPDRPFAIESPAPQRLQADLPAGRDLPFGHHGVVHLLLRDRWPHDNAVHSRSQALR
jgi:hypothetical protein